MILKKIVTARFLWFALVAAVVLPSLASYCTRSWVIGSDGLAYYAPLRSLLIDRDLDFTNEFRDFNPNRHVVPDYSVKTATGFVSNKYGIGLTVAWLPFVLAAHGLIFLLHVFGAAIRADGYSAPYQIAVGIGSMVYGLIGLRFMYKTFRFFFTGEIAALAVLLVATGTNIFFYFIVEPSMSHLVSLCAISLFTYLTVAFHHRHTPRIAMLIGLSIGLMTIVRFQNICFGFILLYEVLDRTNRQSLKTIAPLMCSLLGGLAIAVAPQLVFWKIIYGSFFVYSYGSEGFFFLHPHLLQTLFSVNHGLITWTPLVAFCLVGLYFFITVKQRIWGILMGLVFLVQWYLGASWHCWSFASSFGQRIMADISIVFALGLAAFLERIWGNKMQRFAFLMIAGALVSWNIFLIPVVVGHIFHHPNIITRIFELLPTL